jgi:DNA modification methylase
VDFPTYVNLPFKQESELPSSYNFQDVRYHPEMVRYIINRYTEEGDTIFDPFVGFGTTVVVAQQMKRQAFGVEIDTDKISYLKNDLKLGDAIIQGDVTRMYLDRLPEFDLVLCSPPYMGKNDSADALTGYRFSGSYEGYLDKMQEVFSQIAEQCSPEGKIVIEISNLKNQQSLTPLAWDVGIKLSEVLTFEGEIIICWEGERREGGIYNYGYDHSYLLVYSRP